MRINLVSEHASPLAWFDGTGPHGRHDQDRQNAAHVHVASLAIGLGKLGAEVVVHTRRDDPSLDRRVHLGHGVVVDHVDAGPPTPIDDDSLMHYIGDFADDLARQWQRERPDVVHAHFWTSGVAANAAARRDGIPLALTFHRDAGGCRDLRTPMEAWLARSVDRVIATTAAECRALVVAGADPRRISVVPGGIDLCAFRPDGPRWPDRTMPHRVVCMSPLTARMGLADVVEAVAGMPDVELLIAGDRPGGPVHDDRYVRELSAMIDAAGATGRIVLLGPVDGSRVPSLLRSADVVACTPWDEPPGIVAVEGMACGIPVVATGVGGLAEAVVDGQTGIVVPPRRMHSVRAAIATLLSQPARRAAMGRAAVRRAANYGWDEVAARTLHIVEQLAADPAPGRKRAACGAVPSVRIPSTNSPGGSRAD